MQAEASSSTDTWRHDPDWLSGWVSYPLLAILAFGVFVVGVGVSRVFTGIPIAAVGDALHHLMLAKAMIEQGWTWDIERLSAPFTLPMVLFPVLGTFDSLLMRAVAFVFHDPAIVVTVTAAVMIAIAAVSAAWVLHDLGVDKFTSMAFGLVFAFIPFVFFRTPSHLPMLPHLMPFAIGFAVHLLAGDCTTFSRRQKIVYYGSAVALGLNYIYAAFFACFFVGLAMLLCMFRTGRYRWVAMRRAATFCTLVVAATALSFVPVLIASYKDPNAAKQIIGFKSLGEADVYGLKIRHLLLPSPASEFETLSRLLRDKSFPLENENTTARLGLLAGVGFLGLLGWALWRLAFSAGAKGSRASRLLDPLATLTIATLLLASIGGFGSIFNAFISPEIRAYNRISPFIAFMALAAIASLVSIALSRYPAWTRVLVVAGLAVLAIREQSEFWKMKSSYERSTVLVRNTRPVIDRLEKELPPGAMVYQIPHTAYPHTPPVLGMQSQSHLLAYVLSEGLRWSYPALSSEAIGFNRGLAENPLPRMAENLAAVGFAAIWVNRRGFENGGRDILAQLSAIGLSRIADAEDQSIAVFSLAPIAATLRARFTPQLLEQRRQQTLQFPNSLHTGDTVDFSRAGNSAAVTGTGWSGQEELFRWSEGKRSHVRLVAPALKDYRFTLIFTADPFLFGDHRNQTVSIQLKGSDPVSFRFESGKPFPAIKVTGSGENIAPDGSLEITLLVEDPKSPREVGLSTDDRHLGLAMRSIEIAPADNN